MVAGAPACRQAGIAKNVTIQMTFIVRVMQSCFVNIHSRSLGNELKIPVCSFIVLAKHANNQTLIRSFLF